MLPSPAQIAGEGSGVGVVCTAVAGESARAR